MENVNFTFLSSLENTLTIKNVSSLKQQFFDDYIQETQPQSINFDDGIITDYNSQTDSLGQIYFKDHLLNILQTEIQLCKRQLDKVYLNLDSASRAKFIKYIRYSFNSINNQHNVYKDYPDCKTLVNKMSLYLESRYTIMISIDSVLSSSTSKFGLKEDKKSKLRDLYNISTDHDLIDSDNVSREAFIAVFTQSNIDDRIVFNCYTGLAVWYLETVGVWFRNLNAKSIEESGQFFTKGGKTILTKSNYYKSKSKISKKGKIFLDHFTIDFKKL